MNLTANGFPDFFRACHGYAPFPWQTRLAETVLSDGWPATIALPTASGKTAVLDVAVFALACQADAGPQRRAMPRRIALVVDRRIVVDDAYARARKIRDALAKADTGILKTVADALSRLGGETSLDAALLRGGIYREDRWARTPAQPVILCSTVDQVGSRLLHRGYGLSASMWPIHAGLLGNDCLIVLDEAHCSEPFRQTLDWIGKLRAKAAAPQTTPFTVVTMTATPRSGEPPFALTGGDYGNPTLKARIETRKLATLTTTGKKDADFVGDAVKQARTFAEKGKTVLVVVNRVATARAIRKELAKAKDVDALLLIGRCRSLERDRLLGEWRTRLMAGRKRAETQEAKPLIAVATQCVEVGADFDVDALVTECCAFDALRQRLGRLDRLGELGSSRAVVLIREGQAGTPDELKDDPIYGKALARTWHWLTEKKGGAETIDLGVAALDGTPGKAGLLPADPRARAEELEWLAAPAPDAPIMFPAYCDLWAQTGPEPAVSPEPAIFLHGPERGEPEVRVVWRADLDSNDPQTWAETVSLYRPVSAEALPLPIGLAKKWLAGALEAALDTGDLESAPTDRNEREKPDKREFLPALRWRGPDGSMLAHAAKDIRPGDTLVVPVSYGGCDKEGWSPDVDEPVADLADAARWAARKPAVLRLHPSLPVPEALRPWAEFRAEEWTPESETGLREALRAARGEGEAAALCALLANAGRMRVDRHPSGVGLVLSCDLRPPGDDAADFTDEDDTAAHARTEVPLRAHLAAVETKLRAILKNAGLPDELVEDMALAARLHDVGKADPRFQALLSGGSRLRSGGRELLAKSARMPTDAATFRAARERAGYPEGGRHELLSVRLVESAPSLLDRAHDGELVLHLIESHHGHCRPFAPVVFDDSPAPVKAPEDVAGVAMAYDQATGLERLDSGVADRFWNLIRRYGWWGLAYLEACLRLADHRASEDEEA